MYGYVIIGNRELNLNNNNPNAVQNHNPLQDSNANSNQNEEISRIENPVNRPISNQRALTRVGYTELRNILQIRINLSNENQVRSNSFAVSNENAIHEQQINNNEPSRDITSINSANEEIASINNEINQNISASQIPINDSLTVVSFPNNNQEARESENELLGLIEQVNMQINPQNSL